MMNGLWKTIAIALISAFLTFIVTAINYTTSLKKLEARINLLEIEAVKQQSTIAALQMLSKRIEDTEGKVAGVENKIGIVLERIEHVKEAFGRLEKSFSIWQKSYGNFPEIR